MATTPWELAISDLNLAEALREQTRWLPPGEICEADDLMLTAAGTRFPVGLWNSAMVLGAPPADAEICRDRVHAWFRDRDRSGTLFVRAHADRELAAACERAGWTCHSEVPAMLLGERVSERTLPPDAECRVVTAADAAAFADVMAAAYESLEIPAKVTRKTFVRPERWLAHWHARVVIADGQPVAGAMLLFSHGIAGVYWVGTIPGARGKGYTDSVVRAISNHAFDRGAAAVVLQASPMGEPIYRRIGYREITRHLWYLTPRDAEPNAATEPPEASS
jgi:GNAT superfamily N-acetyltransferase